MCSSATSTVMSLEDPSVASMRSIVVPSAAGVNRSVAVPRHATFRMTDAAPEGDSGAEDSAFSAMSGVENSTLRRTGIPRSTRNAGALNALRPPSTSTRG